MFESYSTETLLRVMEDPKASAKQSFWLRNFFPQIVTFTTEDIIFSKLPGRRKMAPFVRPQNVGQPMYSRLGSEVLSFRPAYIKAKDPVRPGDFFQRGVDEIGRSAPKTPQERFDAEVARVSAYHRDGIELSWEWLAARAILDGTVTVVYADGVSATVDFKRDAGHTVVKSSGYWDSSYDVYADVQLWADIMSAAQFGGILNKIIIGKDVFTAIRENSKIKSMMDLNTKNSSADLKRGLLLQTNREENVRFWGMLDFGVEVWVYDESFENNAGSPVKFMNPKDVLLVGGDPEGVRCYGAIVDQDAQLQALPIFAKMWPEKDPSATLIMSQSAPLMVPQSPNRTFRARVLA